MDQRGEEQLTNEHLVKKFSSQFELVSRAIAVGKHLVVSGASSLNGGDNVAAEVLERFACETPEEVEQEIEAL